MNNVDARGYSCPEPVIMTKKVLVAGTPLTVLVDNQTAVQNISRFAVNSGCKIAVNLHGDDFELVLTK